MPEECNTVSIEQSLGDHSGDQGAALGEPQLWKITTTVHGGLLSRNTSANRVMIASGAWLA